MPRQYGFLTDSQEGKGGDPAGSKEGCLQQIQRHGHKGNLLILFSQRNIEEGAQHDEAKASDHLDDNACP